MIIFSQILGGLLLLAAIAAGLYYVPQRFLQKWAVVTTKMVVVWGILAAVCVGVWQLNVWWATAACCLAVLLVAAVTILRKARLGTWKMLVPVLAGVLAGELVALGAVMLVAPYLPFAVQWNDVLPAMAVMGALLAESNGKALDVYFVGLKHHGQIYEYMLGNGASHEQAVAHFRKNALEMAMIPFLKKMGHLFVGASPMLMWGLLVLKLSAGWVVALGVGFWCVSLVAAVAALVVTLVATRHAAFDEYGRLSTKKTASTGGRDE